MELGVVVLIAAVTAIAGALISLLLFRARAAALEERKAALEQELAATKESNGRLQGEIRQLSEARSALDATLASERRNTEEKLHLLQDSGGRLKSEFEALASKALQDNNASFLQLANSVLQNQQTQASGDLAQKNRRSRLWSSRSRNRSRE